jgi:competence protein ComEC
MGDEQERHNEIAPDKNCVSGSSLVSYLCFQFERFPLLHVSLAQILGIILAWKSANVLDIGQVYTLYLPVLFLSVCGAVLGRIWFNFSPRISWISPVCCLVAGLTWGLVSYSLNTTIQSQEDIRAQMVGKTSAIVIVRGELLERPAISSTKVLRAGVEYTNETCRVSLALNEICWDGDYSEKREFQKATGTVKASCYKVLSEDFTAGALVEVRGVIHLPSDAKTPGGFNYRKYLESQGIYYELKTATTEDWVWKGYQKGIPSLIRRFAGSLRGHWVKMLSVGYDPKDPYIGMYQAMTVGERTALPSEFKEVFTRTGVMHLFAISGFNVGVVAVMTMGLLSLLNISAFWRLGASMLTVCLFAIVAGADPPVCRTALMICVFLLGKMIHRPSQLTNCLGAVCFLLLSWEPGQLFQASFQLSYSVVFSMILLLPTLEKYGEKWAGKDPFLPESLVTKRMRLKEFIALFVLSNIWASLAGWAGSLPLIIHFFNLIPIAGLFVNVLVCVLAFPLQSLSLASLIFGSIWEGFAELCNIPAWWLLYSVEKICSFAEELPGAFLRGNGWYPLSWVFYYLGIIGLFRGFFFQRKNWGWSLGYALILAVYFVFMPKSSPQTSVVVFPAGEGSAILVQDGVDKKDYLIDTGDEKLIQRVVIPYLKKNAQVAGSLDALILTHGDAAHIKGAAHLSQKIKIGDVYVNPLKTRSPYMQRIHKGEEVEIQNPKKLDRGERVGCLEVLHPSSSEDGDFSRGDQGALVLRLQREGKRILFVSDLDPEGQQRLMDREEDLDCDVLVCGVPAYEYFFRAGFLRRCSPMFLIVETQHEKNRPKKTDSDEYPRQVFLSSEEGGIEIVIKEEGGFLFVGEDQYEF